MQLSLLMALAHVRTPVRLRCPPERPAENGMRLCITRLDLDGAPQQGLRLLVLPPTDPVDQAERANGKPPGVDAVRRLAGGPDAFLLIEVRFNGSDNVP